MRTATLLKLGLLASLLLPACGRDTVATHEPASAVLAAPPPAPASPLAIPPAPAAPAVAPAKPGASVQNETIQNDAHPARHATALRVERLVVARGVVGREPQGADTLFAADEKRVYAFVEVDNVEHLSGEVKVQFVEPDGTAQPPMDLPIGESARWRTWAFTRRAHVPGTWKALVCDARGHVLASTEFEVRG